MNRRTFLELTGLVATVDLGDGVEQAGAAPVIDPDEARYQAVLARFPSYREPGSHATTVTLSARPHTEYLTDPELLGDADVVVGTFAENAMVATGIAGLPPDRVRDILVARGYVPQGHVGGRELLGTWEGRRYRGVIADSSAVHVGLGPERNAVKRWLSVSVPNRTGDSPTIPAIRTAVDRLGPVTVASVDPHRALGGDDIADPRFGGPLVTARGIALKWGTASVREVAVYVTDAAAERAITNGTTTLGVPIEPLQAPSTRRSGRTVVRDAFTDAETVLAPQSGES